MKKVSQTHTKLTKPSPHIKIKETYSTDSYSNQHITEQLAYHSAIVDSSEDAIISKNLNGIITSWNKAAEELLGYSEEEAIGKSITMIVPPELIYEEKMIISSIKQGKRIEHHETVRVRKDGTKIHLSLSISPIKTTTGKIIGAAKIARDISKQKSLENEIKYNQDRLAFLADASRTLSSNVISEDTLKTIAKLIVPYFADYTRIVLVDENKQIKEIAINHIDPKKIPLVKKLYDAYSNMHTINGIHKLLATGKSEIIPDLSPEIYKSIENNPHLSKILKTLHLTSYIGVPLKVREKIIGAIIFSSTQTNKKYTLADLSFAEDLGSRAALAIENSQLFANLQKELAERKRTESAFRDSEERLRLALEAGKIGVWDWDIQENTLIWSDRVYDLYGTSRDTFTVNYENFSKYLFPEDKQIAKDAIKKALAGKKEYDITYRILTLNGKVKWIASRAIVTRDSKGNPLRMLGATSDVTEQKKIEQDKNDFVSIATHELKTPVTSIKAYAQVLQKKFKRLGDEASAKQLEKMDAQLDKLTSLIADLLDATKIESGKLYMHQESFDFNELIREIVEELQRTTEKHTIHIEGSIKKKITADRERTGQVLTNLLSNAIKYSPHTEKIIVKVETNKAKVQLCVKDYGVGIAKDKQARVFERFYRVSGPKEITFPGLGLGLYISSEIIKRQGGEIWVESDENDGSLFCFTLPFITIPKQPKTKIVESDLQHG